MKVNVKMPRDVTFESLNYGDVFYTYGGAYIKIIPLLDRSDDLYNAVNLSDGSLEYFDDGKLVNKLDSELNAKLELVSE
jgi:hypothetical protein